MIELFYGTDSSSPLSEDVDQMEKFALLGTDRSLQRQESTDSPVCGTDLAPSSRYTLNASPSTGMKTQTVATSSDSKCLHSESIDIEMVSTNTSLDRQWSVFVYTFLVSSAMTLCQYFVPLFHAAPIFGTVASTYLWNLDLC